MSESTAFRTPFVLGKPIKNPADFYGRRDVLRELFELAKGSQLVSLVGEHRCGNTSVIYQMMASEVQEDFLTPAERDSMVFAFISSQLASEGPEAFFRRVQRALRRADPDAQVDYRAAPDTVWLEEYLEDLSDRNRKLVLLLDEFEVLADYDEAFWEWFEGLITLYDVAIVATTRQDLGEFRVRSQRGPQFFNLFRSLYIGSFSPETMEVFLADKTELTDFDFNGVRDELRALAGRYPFYLQSAAALLYLHGGMTGRIDEDTLRTVRREFRARVWALFDDAWHKLPTAEREALTWLVLQARPGGSEELAFAEASQSLERRGYVIDGTIFSEVFADFVRQEYRRIALSPTTGKVRVGRRLVDLPTEQVALLRLMLSTDGELVSGDTIAHAVWPDFIEDGRPVSPDRIRQTVEGLRAALEEGGDHQHVEDHGSAGWRFYNPRWPEEGEPD